MKQDSLGKFEQLVLLALLRLGDNAYGVSIRREIEGTGKHRTSFGAVYTTLDRMEAKGYVKSRTGEATPERGGRAKRYFKVTAAGAAVLRRSVSVAQQMTKGLEPLLGGASR